MSIMKKKLSILFFLIGCFLVFGGFFVSKTGYDIHIGYQKIQESIDKKIPFETNGIKIDKALFSFNNNLPIINLSGSYNELIMHKKLSGDFSISLSANIYYNNIKHDFFIASPILNEANINGHEIDINKHHRAINFITNVSADFLKHIPVYTIKNKTWKDYLMTTSLTNIHFEKDYMVVHLNPFQILIEILYVIGSLFIAVFLLFVILKR